MASICTYGRLKDNAVVKQRFIKLNVDHALKNAVLLLGSIYQYPEKPSSSIMFIVQEVGSRTHVFQMHMAAITFYNTRWIVYHAVK